MKDLILIVDDNEDILYNIKMTLELNDYDVKTAKNGKEAIKVLSEQVKLPNLIISDIMMPEMNGYDFFRIVSQNPNWGTIPFLFLTAKTSPRDIRFGKMLGVDDYLIKPFDNEDLLAIISGKIARSKKINSISELIKKKIDDIEIELKPLLNIEEKSSVNLFYMFWDDRVGPSLKSCYPENNQCSFSLEKVGVQLYNSSVAIYGQKSISEARGLLINVKNINQDGYIYFDSYFDKKIRGGRQEFMIAVIAPRINYFATLKMKETLEAISAKIKNEQFIDLKIYWEIITDILTKEESEIAKISDIR